MAHLTKEKLISPYQHGFLSGRSCITNLLEAIDILTGALNDGYMIAMVLLDLAKAFDLVPHEEMIRKAETYGIKGQTLEWIRDFLNDRKQRVVIGQRESMWLDVESGVPQGFCIGKNKTYFE